MSDPETLKAYAEAAERYGQGFARTKDTDQEADYAAFTARLPAGGKVLDLGCGPGHWTARMLGDGYAAQGMDASPEMADYAHKTYGITVTQGLFDDMPTDGSFDGVWANFSLLHAPKADFPRYLDMVHQALRPGGTLSIGMKLGTGEARDNLGRFYAYYSQDALADHLDAAGFILLRARQGNGKGLAGHDDTFVVMTAHA